MPLKSDRKQAPQREERHYKTPYRLETRKTGDDPWVLDEWVHCPICRARSAGFAGSRPRYDGGFVVIELVGGNGKCFVVACTCWLGQRRRRAFESLTRLDDYDPRTIKRLFPRETPTGGYRVVDAHGEIATVAPEGEPTVLRPAHQGDEPEHVQGDLLL